MAGSINGSDYGILNWDRPTIVPPNAERSSPDVSLASPSLIISLSWQTLFTLRPSTNHRSTSNLCQTKLQKANWDRYRQEVEACFVCLFGGFVPYR